MTNQMLTRAHPTHARTTRIVMSILLGGAALAFGAASYFNDHDGSSAQSLVLSGSFMSLLMAVMVVAVARAFICKCPDCLAWLTTRAKPTVDLNTRVFICRHCNTAWDTTIRFNDD